MNFGISSGLTTAGGSLSSASETLGAGLEGNGTASFRSERLLSPRPMPGLRRAEARSEVSNAERVGRADEGGAGCEWKVVCGMGSVRGACGPALVLVLREKKLRFSLMPLGVATKKVNAVGDWRDGCDWAAVSGGGGGLMGWMLIVGWDCGNGVLEDWSGDIGGSTSMVVMPGRWSLLGG